MAFVPVPSDHKFRRGQALSWRGQIVSYVKKAKNTAKIVVKLPNGVHVPVWISDVRVDK